MANPISRYVLKVDGRCDLACDACYVFDDLRNDPVAALLAADGALTPVGRRFVTGMAGTA